MVSSEPNFNFPFIINVGEIVRRTGVNIKCARLAGNGLIKGPKMKIEAASCEYEGVIECQRSVRVDY